MTPLRTASSILGILAAVCLVLVQFLPWGGIGGSFFGASFSVDANTWNMESRGSSEFGSGSDKVSWYDDEATEEEGSEGEVRQIRIAIPVLLGALGLLGIGGILGLVMRGPAAGILVMVGGLLAAIGTALFAMAVDGLFDSDQDWGAAFYLAITASSLGLVGGILGVVPAGRSS